MKKHDIIIIGSGPSGLYACYLSKMHGLDSIILEATDKYGGQMNLFKDKPVYDMPALNNVNGLDIMNAFVKQLDATKMESIHYEQEVLEIKGEYNNFIVKTNKKEYYCKTIIIASGSGYFTPSKLGIKNEDHILNINYSVNDTSKLINKKILIFGGGDSAVDWTHYFYKKGLDVTLIHRREKFRAQDYLLNQMKDEVNIYTPYKLISFDEKENRIIQVTLQNVNE